MKDKQIMYDGIEFGLSNGDLYIPASYIIFCRENAQELGKVTKIWTVREGTGSLHGDDLGQVRWFPRWRKYSFFSSADKVFEETCLREIAFFCETATRMHKALNKAATV